MSCISALLLTFNEEKNIGTVINNLKFADEIIVIDSFSNDNTIVIASSYPNVKIYYHKFMNFTDQRNFALTKAKYEWILFIDADERITRNLKDEILYTVSCKDTADAYYFFRKFYFKNKPLHFSGWQTDKNIRLFKKSKCHYSSERMVHEVLKVSGNVSTLKNKLIHYSYENFKSYKRKMKNYANLRALELNKKGLKPNAYHFVVKPLYKFLYDYIIRFGILDGKKGVIICYLNAYGVYKRYPELKKLIKKQITS